MTSNEEPIAYEVIQNGDSVGYLGSVGGPFITVRRSKLKNPVFEHARFTSQRFSSESIIYQILSQEDNIQKICESLKKQGFEIQEVSYKQVFPIFQP